MARQGDGLCQFRRRRGLSVRWRGSCWPRRRWGAAGHGSSRGESCGCRQCERLGSQRRGLGRWMWGSPGPAAVKWCRAWGASITADTGDSRVTRAAYSLHSRGLIAYMTPPAGGRSCG